MACISDLVSAGIIEKDINNDVLWTWSYPSISTEYKTLIINKCGLGNGLGLSHGHHLVSFCYYHHQQSWFYLHLTDVFEHPTLLKVKQFVLVLQTRDFNPERYENFSHILSKTYSKTGNPASMLQLYLSVLVRGSCSTEDNGTFKIKHFDQIATFLCVPAKDVVKIFGLETILIYTALLLKKRIVVYHHRLDSLLWFVRALPAFMWHRQDWSIIYPYMQLTNVEISELLSLQTYIAGFRDAAVEGRTELYDVFVNLPAIEITVAAHAKEMFAMTKTHKEIAVFMTRQAENMDLNDTLFIKEVANKTNELLRSLRNLAVRNESGKEVIKLSELKENKFAPALENFLWNLAAAEGYTHI
ncbi:DENN domain-containing protein 10 [Trichonephila clavata]|uniref:DENN domain-containing protein 10 n=1 Tax=Trichonephila clavata TaxID=2740835 RepID=A0A8X6LAH3_TRICU|nr:DENN domain-containing protein 10 [Trichonephila clavata]